MSLSVHSPVSLIKNASTTLDNAYFRYLLTVKTFENVQGVVLYSLWQ